MPDFQEPSGEALRRQRELVEEHERMMSRGIESFRVYADARQSADTTVSFSAQRSYTSRHLQHWEVRPGQSGYCQIDGCSALAFPLIEFRERYGRVLIKFTVPRHRIRGSAGRTHLDLWDGEIFGEVLEWRQRLDEDSIDFTLHLQLEAFEARSQPNEAVRYTFDVDTIRYRRGDADAYRLSLERAGLLPDRVEALRELMQERSMPDAHDRRVLAEDWHYRRMESAGIFEALRQERSQARSQPPIKQPSLCNGCRNLHGQYHGGTLLVCAMHPYGNGEDCSDFEGK